VDVGPGRGDHLIPWTVAPFNMSTNPLIRHQPSLMLVSATDVVVSWPVSRGSESVASRLPLEVRFNQAAGPGKHGHSREPGDPEHNA